MCRFAFESNPVQNNWFIGQPASRARFAQLDLNNDGVIDEDELNQFALAVALSQNAAAGQTRSVAGIGLNAAMQHSSDFVDPITGEELAAVSPKHEHHCILAAIAVVRSVLDSAITTPWTKVILGVLVAPFEDLGKDATQFCSLVMPLLSRMVTRVRVRVRGVFPHTAYRHHR